MSATGECCSQCGQFVPPVNIPGAPGTDGTPGAQGSPGIDSFTITTSDFVVPAIGSQIVALGVANSTWMTVGQNVFVQGAGNFSVDSKPSSTTVTMTYLNYTGNTNSGNNITAGAQVSPSGVQPPISANTLLPFLTGYGVGGSQVVTTTPAQALSLQVTLAAGTYLLMATVRYDYVGATFAANRTVETKLRETTNGPADVSNAIATFDTDIITTKTYTARMVTLPPVSYTAALGDTVQMFVSVDTLPTAGSLEVIEASLVAIPVF